MMFAQIDRLFIEGWKIGHQQLMFQVNRISNPELNSFQNACLFYQNYYVTVLLAFTLLYHMYNMLTW